MGTDIPDMLVPRAWPGRAPRSDIRITYDEAATKLSGVMADFVPRPRQVNGRVTALEALDIRVGTIQSLRPTWRSRKLVKLTVTFGQLLAADPGGPKTERADVREIEGRQALFVVNLAPREMAGEMSEGMLFDIGYADGITPVLAVPEHRCPTASARGRFVLVAPLEGGAVGSWFRGSRVGHSSRGCPRTKRTPRSALSSVG